MQTLEIISLNIWQVVISLCNLLILFLILKKFLFGPVKKVLKQRQDALDAEYTKAEQALHDAEQNKAQWDKKISTVSEEADKILEDANITARRRGEKIVSDAKTEAGSILRQAEANASLEKKKAADDIKREIVEVSTLLAEQMIGREINKDDHEQLIKQFIDNIGDDNDGE